jgi:large subunit ribosomal protein L4
MTDITVLNSKFENSGKISTQIELSPEKINVPVVHQVVKAALANRRQGNASTKTKGLVRGGGAKPFKQKGTGRARQGSTRSPLMPGGGVAFGPTKRSYDQKINKKVALGAIQSVIADKLQAGKLTVVDSFNSDGKTKTMFNTLDGKGLLPALLVTSKREDLAIRAVSNIARGKGICVEGFSVYEAFKYENLVIEKEALEKLLNKLV